MKHPKPTSIFRKPNTFLILFALVAAVLFINSTVVRTAQHDQRVVSAVSPIKMNMLYIGVDNPLEVAVSGYDNRQLDLTISEGTIEAQGDGIYIARPTKPGTATVSISSTNANGETRLICEKVFRVSRIPDPKVLLGNKQGPVITAGEIKTMIGLVAIADNFPFDVKFAIRGFNIAHRSVRDASDPPTLKELYNETAAFSEEAKALLGSCEPGDRIWFDDIKIAAPDGTTRSADLSFKVIGG